MQQFLFSLDTIDILREVKKLSKIVFSLFAKYAILDEFYLIVSHMDPRTSIFASIKFIFYIGFIQNHGQEK